MAAAYVYLLLSSDRFSMYFKCQRLWTAFQYTPIASLAQSSISQYKKSKIQVPRAFCRNFAIELCVKDTFGAYWKDEFRDVDI